MTTACRRRLAPYASALLLVALAAGCSDGTSSNAGSESAVTPTTTVTKTVTETAEPHTPSPSAGATGQEAPDDTDSPAPGSVPATDGPIVRKEVVTSPSGNIMCTLEYGLECWIAENDYAPMPEDDCEYDWLDFGFMIGDEAGERGVCRSDYPFGAEPVVLPYGTTTEVGAQACKSTEAGMVCWNRLSEHGFRISRASYDLF